MDVGEVEAPADADAVHGAGQMQLRGDIAVDSAGLTAHELGELAEAGVRDSEVEVDAAWARRTSGR